MRRLPYNARLVLLALVMSLLWLVGGSRGGAAVWDTVRGGQNLLWERQKEAGVPLSDREDKLKTGFIGVEWSTLTTTLGSLEAKRTSADPAWAAQFLGWFDELGVRKGDRIVIYSSSSFPAMLFSAVAAAENRGLEVLLAVSLGSSTWGANRPEFPLPEIWRVLLEGGYVKTRPAFYTLGGAGEAGRDFSPETARSLGELAETEGTPLITTESLERMILYKTQRMLDFTPKLFINIGGSHANLGDSADSAEIPNGLLLPENAASHPVGEGVIARALLSGVPTLNILNIRKLALENGIPWDPVKFTKRRYRHKVWIALAGLALFFAVLGTHKRWAWEDEEG